MSDLRPVTTELPARWYGREIWRRADYLATVPRQELRAANLDTVLGNIWFLLNPALQVTVFYLIFGLLLRTDKGIDNFISYLTIGVLTFTLISRTMLQASNSLGQNIGLIRSLYFPRAIIPLSTVVTNIHTYLPGLVVIVFLVLVTGEPVRLRWLLVPAVLAIIVPIMAGLAFWTGRLGWRYPDLGSLLPYLTRLLFYMSAVLFDPYEFTSNKTVLAIFSINPAYEVILLMRWIFLDVHTPWYIWLLAIGWAVGLSTTGYLYFWRGEASYGASR